MAKSDVVTGLKDAVRFARGEPSDCRTHVHFVQPRRRSRCLRVLQLIDQTQDTLKRFPSHNEIEAHCQVDPWRIGSVLTQLVRSGFLTRELRTDGARGRAGQRLKYLYQRTRKGMA